MIDKNLEPYYDILFSVFIGVVIILLLHNLYDSPRIVVVIPDVQDVSEIPTNERDDNNKKFNIK